MKCNRQFRKIGATCKLTLLYIVFLFISCRFAPKTPGVDFRETTYFQYENQNQWIETAGDEVRILAYAENADLDKLKKIYDKKARYIFLAGGGCFSATEQEMEAQISNDTLYIIWHEPQRPCPSTGKKEQTCMSLEIDKSRYPDYKNFKIILKK